MTTKLDVLTSAVQAAMRTTVDSTAILSQEKTPVRYGAILTSKIWRVETMLVGSLLKFAPTGQTGAFYATVVAGDRAELTLFYSGGTGPFTKMTGQGLKEAGLTH